MGECFANEGRKKEKRTYHKPFSINGLNRFIEGKKKL
jgi:hypothetical protein